MTRSRLGVTAGVVAALVVLAAGCIAIPGDDVPTAAELEAKIEDADPPETAVATVETTDSAGEETQYVKRIWMHEDGRTRVETTIPDGETHLNVDDGERAWFYDEGADRVRVIDSEHTGDSHFEYLYDEQRRYFEELEVTAIEPATVDGRDAYHVTFEPPQDEPVDRTITVLVGDTEFVLPLESGDSAAEAGENYAVDRIDVWIDRETLFPLEQALEGGDRNLDVRWRYTDVAFDVAIEDDRFAFDVPPDATVMQDVHPVGKPVDTVAAAEREANVTVDEPSWLPEGFERREVTYAEYFFEDLTDVTIQYTDDDAVVAVTASPEPRPFAIDGGDPIDESTLESAGLAADATAAETAFGTRVEWGCGDRSYGLFATDDLEAETALEIAASADCGGDGSDETAR